MTATSTTSFDPSVLAYLTPKEREALDRLLLTDTALWRPLPGPQRMAYESTADIVGYGGAAGGGKLQPLDAKVLTPKGWRAIGNLKIGDAVIDPTTGGVTRVVGVFPQGVVDIYRVTMDDGASTEVGLEHLWAYKRNGHYGRRPRTKHSSERAKANALLSGEPATLDRWTTLRVGTTRELTALLAVGERPRIPRYSYRGEARTGRDVYDVYIQMRAVSSIEFSRKAEAVCIAVASPFGLYVTDDYIVTHNTSLAIGKALTQHQKAMILRREATQLTSIIDDITAILGTRDGYNGADRIWRLPDGRQIEFGSAPNAGDERRYQGRPHDLLAFDEAASFLESQVRFLLGWLRTTDPNQRCQALLTFNPPTTVEGRWIVDFFAPWLDRKHPRPAKPGELRWFAMVDGEEVEVESGRPFTHRGERIKPMSRTFIPSRVSDNPYLMGTGYMATLQALPEPLRSQMLYGDFTAGIEDDPWQVIPTAWVEAAQARWKRPDKLPPMDSLGVDVARGGRDSTIIARRHGMWFDEPLVYPGDATPDGPKVAGLVMAAMRDQAPIHIDVIGVGSSPYDFLSQAGLQVVGVNVAEASGGTDKSGRLRFKNLRSELWWRMREALDPTNNTGIALPPDPRLLADLCAPTWELAGSTIAVASRERIVEKLGRSPDFGSAYVLALMDTPKLSVLRAIGKSRLKDYDPYA
jgi:hypothetical protein